MKNAFTKGSVVSSSVRQFLRATIADLLVP
jgi:hypothetical protein